MNLSLKSDAEKKNASQDSSSSAGQNLVGGNPSAAPNQSDTKQEQPKTEKSSEQPAVATQVTQETQEEKSQLTHYLCLSANQQTIILLPREKINRLKFVDRVASTDDPDLIAEMDRRIELNLHNMRARIRKISRVEANAYRESARLQARAAVVEIGSGRAAAISGTLGS